MYAGSTVPTHTTPDNGERNVNILLVGQTGVGRSSLINMITGATDGSVQAAKVSNDVRPCHIEATVTVHTALPEADGTTLHYNLWETRGLDEPVDLPNFMAKWLRLQGFGSSSKCQSERDLQNICLERINDLKDGDHSRPASIVILMWCIHASKIDSPIHWQHFRRIYVDYCNRRVKPVVVITQMTPSFENEWEKKCKDQLKVLRMGLDGTDDLLLMVRRYRSTSSPEYTEDSLALRHLVFRLSG